VSFCHYNDMDDAWWLTRLVPSQQDIISTQPHSSAAPLVNVIMKQQAIGVVEMTYDER